jgi:RNA polymerase sigma factor (sigma-70 family)
MEGVGSSLIPPPQPNEGFEPWETKIAQDVVRAYLDAGFGSPVRDADDILQEALLHWWLQRDRYREERQASRRTFMRRVLNAKLVDLAREAKAAKRGGGHITDSLDREVDEVRVDGSVLGDLIPDNVDVEAEGSLRVDLERGVALLTERQRLIVRTLGAGYRISEVSRRSGLSRDSLHEELRRIRRTFRDAGLGDYLR